MIHLVIFITFAILSFRVANSIQNESAIFIEFNQPRTIGWLAFLFPLGPIIHVSLIYRFGLLPSIVLMVACYLPPLISAKQCISIFERAGTDRVNKAKEAAFQAYGTSIAGPVYTAVILVIRVADRAIA